MSWMLGIWQGLALVVVISTAVLYGRGWRRLRQRYPDLAKPGRWFAFVLALLLILLPHFPPIYTASEQLLAARSVMNICTAMLAPPLLWLSLPAHTLLLGLPSALRCSFTRLMFTSSPSRSVIHALSTPGVAWLLFLGAIVFWHDARFVNWSMTQHWARQLSLWVLLGAGLMYWGHIVGTAPHLHQRVPLWIYFACLIGIEIPNMASGMTVAFTPRPIYDYYVAAHAALPNRFGLDVQSDQVLAGGLIWFCGSIVYFGSAVLIFRALIPREQPKPFPEWDSDERMIAPGLEHRLPKK